MIGDRYQNRIGSKQRAETFFKPGNKLIISCKVGKSKGPIPGADFRIDFLGASGSGLIT
jgi:hypothetical protein